MKYVLLIVLTINITNQDSKDIELRIPYENKEECLKASKKIDFSFKFHVQYSEFFDLGDDDWNLEQTILLGEAEVVALNGRSMGSPKSV